MAIRRRIGNDIPVKWTVMRGDGTAEDFSGKSVRVFLRERHGQTLEVQNLLISGNIVSFTWSAEEQYGIGEYDIILKEYKDNRLVNTVDIASAIILVPHTAMENGDEDYIDDSEVTFRSDFEVVFPSINKALEAAQTASSKGEEADVKSQSLSEVIASAQYIYDNLEKLLDNYYQSFGNGVIPHDHEGQLIRPSVFAIPTLEPTASCNIRENEYYLYVSTGYAVSGEEPTKIGLDEDELWGILGGSDENIKNKIIDESHIPVLDVSKIDGLEGALEDLDSDFVTLYTDQTITGEKTFANNVIFGGKVSEGVFGSMFIPSNEGSGKYSLYVSTDPVSGETPTAPSGLDEEAMWTALGTPDSSKVIDLSHIPSIPTSKITGLDTVLASYATQAWVQQNFLASVSLATISDLDSGWDALLKVAPSYYSKAEIGSLLSSYYTKTDADGRFVGVTNEQTVSGKKTFSSLLTAGGGISSTNADFSGYVSADVLYLPYSGGNKMYSLYVSTDPVSGETPTAPSGLDEEAMWTALGTPDSSKVIDLSHIPSIPTSKITGLDSSLSSYVKKAGDTMTGPLNISSSSEALIRYQISGSNKAATGYLASQGAYLYSWPAGKYLHITDAGSLLFGGSTVWHSGNDGSGSGLDADLLDGQHGSYYAITTDLGNVDFNTATRSGIYRLSYTTSNGASNGPSGNEWGNMLVLRGRGDTIAQLAFGYTSSDRPKYRQGNPSNVGGAGSWTQWYTLATTLDNVYSATRLQTSRTLWGRPFDGTGNVSGDMSGVGGITASGFDLAAGNFNLYESASHQVRLSQNWSNNVARIYAINNSGSGYYDMSLGQTPGNNAALYFDASAAAWGIGTTSPAYKLDVAGEIRATSGITIGSTDDYGWYNNVGRICAGMGVARGVNVGSLLVSSGWADYTKVPTNGIYSKGDIWTGGKLYIPSTQGNNVFDAYIA